eukprot:jgi/Mesvir1/14658/Mv05326-RA.1
MTKDTMYAPGVANRLETVPTKRVRVHYAIREHPASPAYPVDEIRYKFLDKTLYMWVPIPDGYSSALTAELRKKSRDHETYDDLAYVQIDSRHRDKLHTPPGADPRNAKNNYLYLEWFYVRPQQFAEGTKTERASLSGLGKKMLCAALYLMSERGFVANPTTAVVGLEAGGGACREPEKHPEGKAPKSDPKAETDAMSVAELREFLARYPPTERHVAVTTKKMSEEDEIAFVRKTVCEIKGNQGLESYYGTFGFRTFDARNGLGFLMEAPFATVTGACNSLYGPLDLLPDIEMTRARSRSTRSSSSSASLPGPASATVTPAAAG